MLSVFKMCSKTFKVLNFIILFSVISCEAVNPNIVLIMADDMGWNDVSFHGSDQILTPNIDMLARAGVSFGRYYSHPSCTPSRAALLTGKYPHKIGMHGYPIVMSEDRGIPTSVPIIPEYFREAGYSTHLVGKWHVGSSRKEFLPTARGFQSHFGHRSGLIDYYEYTYEETLSVGTVSGLALFKNYTAAWDVEGYITDVYTEEAISVIENHDKSSPLFLMVTHNAPHAGSDCNPLQAPPEVVREMRHVETPGRRILAAMIKKLDDSVGEIVQALHKKEMLNNTIIVFVSDNGGMTSTGRYQNYASNYPLRGIKMSPFEGGVRVVGLLWSANLNNTSHNYDGYIHVTDWLPTLLTAAGLKVPLDIDGINQWESINANTASQRKVIYDIDDSTGFSTIISGDFKLITGNVIQSYGTYQGSELRGIIGKAPSYVDAILDSNVYKVFESHGFSFGIDMLSARNKTRIECGVSPTTLCYPSNDTVCLYNIIEDPCETTELSDVYPDLVSSMQALLQAEAKNIIHRIQPAYRNPLSVPSLFNYTWDTWMESNSS